MWANLYVYVPAIIPFWCTTVGSAGEQASKQNIKKKWIVRE